MMQDLLFLAHRIPFPPDKGDKIRSWNLLRHLSKRFRIHLGAFIDTPEDLRHAPILEVLCESAHFEVLNPRAARRRSARGFFTGEPLSFPYYRHAGMQAWVDSVCERIKPAVGFAFSSQVAPYLLSGSTLEGASRMKLVFDFVDVDSAKWEEYAHDAGFPMDWVYRREARLLAAAEARLSQSADATLLVTEAEAALLRQRSGLDGAKIFSVGNGVDLSGFAPDAAVLNPYSGDPDQKILIFTGAMDYWANIDAVS
jgi:sugar transferase (PEP-CTERM/EpsH1 system associated)